MAGLLKDKQLFSFYNQSYFKARGRWFPWTKAFFFASWIKLFCRPRTLLDVGCARGELVFCSRFLGIKAFGIDISPDALRQVPRAVKNFCYHGSITALNFKKNSFDFITALALLEHIPHHNLGQALRELERVALKGLVLQICVPDSPWERNRHYLRDPTHVNIRPSSWWQKVFQQRYWRFREIFPRSGLFLIKF